MFATAIHDPCSTRSFHPVPFLCVVWLAWPATASAQRTITTPTIQDGGVLVVAPAGDLRIENSASLLLSGGATTSGVEDLLVGSGFSNVGGLLIETAAVASSDQGIVGQIVDSFGEVIVRGSGSRWEMQGMLFVGDAGGEGTLDITGGGTVSSAGGLIGSASSTGAVGEGAVTVSGAGSRWDVVNSPTFLGVLRVGVSAQGELNILNGATVSNEAAVQLGTLNFSQTPGGSGSATVSGVGSRWEVGSSLDIGHETEGSVEVLDGGVIYHTGVAFNDSIYLGGSGSGIPGAAGDGALKIAGAGSQLSSNRDLFVGFDGDGTLDISGGGAANARSLVVGNRSGSIGRANVSGVGSVFSGSLQVGDRGDGGLTVEGGGTVTASSVRIADEAGAVGRVLVTGPGSRLETDFLSFGGGAGSLIVSEGGALTVANQLFISETAVISGDGGSIVGNVLNGGVVSPGDSPGALTIDGDLQNTGTLLFEIAGNSAFDVLDIDGELTTGGAISIALLDGFVPAVGSSFDLVDFSGFVDDGFEFDLSMADLGPHGLRWETGRFALDGSVSVVAVPEPASLGVLVTAIVGMAVRRFRRRADDFACAVQGRCGILTTPGDVARPGLETPTRARHLNGTTRD